MATIKPFKAYRPAKGSEARIAALPYDVYNSQEAREVVEKNPTSFLGIDRAETQFPAGTSPYEDFVYEKAASMLHTAMEDGTFRQEASPCYYIYAQTWQGRTQTGIVACASIDDYEAGVIKKHENTRADKEQDRIRHISTCQAQTGPIFLAYRNDARIDEIVQKTVAGEPDCDFISEGQVRNQVWTIREPKDIAVIASSFAQIKDIYIADGHHRCASAVKVGLQRRAEHPDYTGEEDFNFFLSVLFPQDQLEILPYYRVLRNLHGHTPESLLTKIQDAGFTLENCGQSPVAPAGKGEFGLYLADTWYRLRADSSLCSEDPVEGLDVSILQKNILEPLFDIQDPRTDPDIDFVGGIRGLKELERRVHTDMQAAFSTYPTSIEELFRVADAGRLMPPKSTWFEPKLLSGLFIHPI